MQFPRQLIISLVGLSTFYHVVQDSQEFLQCWLLLIARGICGNLILTSLVSDGLDNTAITSLVTNIVDAFPILDFL